MIPVIGYLVYLSLLALVENFRCWVVKISIHRISSIDHRLDQAFRNGEWERERINKELLDNSRRLKALEASRKIASKANAKKVNAAKGAA